MLVQTGKSPKSTLIKLSFEVYGCLKLLPAVALPAPDQTESTESATATSKTAIDKSEKH